MNGSFSHNIFNGTFGLNVVDFDDEQNIMSLAGRRQIPEPTTLLLLSAGFLGLACRRRR